jgi:drug/metabolite transporter, DME family
VLLVLAALPTFHTLVGLSSSSYALLVMLAVVHTALAFGLYTVGLKRLDAGQAAIVATVEPVVAGAIGVVLLGEELTALKVIGALLVLAGAALAQVRFEKTSRGSAVLEDPSQPR